VSPLPSTLTTGFLEFFHAAQIRALLEHAGARIRSVFQALRERRRDNENDL
jgi:hypothetical protein